MRHFNYREVFEKFFPYYYKENDSYKDAEGKGLLERLITTCTEYFDTDVMANHSFPGLDNIVDIIDLDKTPEIFLNYLWEYLGEIPYAWGVLTNGQPYTKENLESWLSSSRGYPRADPRKALKYAISLYKIRGTNQFYGLLGKLYGVKIDLVDAATGAHILQGDFIKGIYDEVYSSYPSDENPEEGVTSQYPVYGYTREEDCTSCIQIEIHIQIPSGTYQSLMSSKTIDIYNVKQAFQRIVGKYLPVYCKPLPVEDVVLEEYVPTLVVR